MEKSPKRLRLAMADIKTSKSEGSCSVKANGQRRQKNNANASNDKVSMEDCGIDPSIWWLHCQPESHQKSILWWHSPAVPIKFEVELALEPVLVPYEHREWGMFKSQPQYRIQQLRRTCQQYHIPLTTALSLRRHLMKRYNPKLGMSKLQLGNEEDINRSAHLFEKAVQVFLERNRVPFYPEEMQRDHIRNCKPANVPYPPTPDFVMRRPLIIKKYIMKNTKRLIIEEFSVNCESRHDCLHLLRNYRAILLRSMPHILSRD